jgi:uncharacterized membrane protein YgcG
MLPAMLRPVTIRRRKLRAAPFAAIPAILAVLATVLLGSAPEVHAAGPPYPDPVDGQAVYDTAGLFSPDAREKAEAIVDAIEAQTKAEIAVYTQGLGRDDITPEEAEADAVALMDQWGVGRVGIDDGLVILFDLDTSLKHGQVRMHPGPGFADRYMSGDDLQAVFDDQMLPLLADQAFDDALLTGLASIAGATLDNPTEPPPDSGPQLAPGPPYPDPEVDRAVYDFAGILSPETIVNAESTIDRIENRTGAEVVVYTELADYGVSTDETMARARALIDQWGVGRKGFDDGLAIFFDIDPSLHHGQVQLYAGPGFEAAFMSNTERQRIYEDDMLPFLRNADFDGALGVALAKVDAAATPEHAARLQIGRQVNAVVGLVGAPIVLLGLAGWAFFSWRRFGKDPVYLDDPSILMPAPPPELTAASGAFILDGGPSRRALTTAMLDLASRGLLSFREDRGFLGMSNKVGIVTAPERGDDVEEAQRARNARRPIGPAEEYALRELRDLGESEQFIEADELPKFGSSVSDFNSKLETHVVGRGWMTEKPSKVIARWAGRGVLAIVAGVVAIVVGGNIPASGLVLLGVAAVVGGVFIAIVAKSMPSVTMAGAMIRAMLAAYRRTLQKTMDQARSMQQVVDQAGLAWLETPDQAVVWGTALGLQGEIEAVLQRSLADVRDTPTLASSTYFPTWYTTSSGSSFASGVAAGSGGSIFSGSAVPDLGGMMSSLGTIGNSPSSSGGSGGGFGGGGSGGGGGGAGGEF